MAIFSTIAAVAAVASVGYGIYEKEEGKKKAQEGYELQQQGAAIQAQAARDQAQISKDQAASSVTFAGQERNINTLAAQQSIAASNASHVLNRDNVLLNQNTENQRRQAMELDARRSQLEVIRNQQRGRALGLASATASGSSRGSGLQGGYGQIQGQSGVNLLGIQQCLEIGRNIFGNNAAITQNNLALGDLENQYAIQQANNQTSKANLAYDYAVANAGFTNRMADTQVLASQGAGYVAQGGGKVAQGNAQIASGNSFIQAGPSLFSAGMNADKLFGGSSVSGFNNLFGSSSNNPYDITGSLY